MADYKAIIIGVQKIHIDGHRHCEDIDFNFFERVI